MMPRSGRVAARQTAKADETYNAYSFPGPSLGWVSDQNLAVSQPGGAYRLENIFPTATGGIMRRGCSRWAELENPVRSMFGYNSGGSQKMFAGVDGGIFNVTATMDPVEEHTATDGNWIVAQYASSDGVLFLRGVNGVDTPFTYDGTTFSTTPALTFPSPETLTPDVLSYVWVFKNRFFFIRKGSLDAWYLPVGQIGGELVKLPLGGEFTLGGALMFGATWSLEAGDGLSAMCAFFTDAGEVAVYQGSDPGQVSSWSKVGVYFIGKPRGPNAFIRRGGDLVIATDIGFVSLSQALQKDTPSLAPTAMSAPIEVDWNNFVTGRADRTWSAVVWSGGQMVAIALPTVSSQTPTWLVANARTGRWAAFTGWDASCLLEFQDRLYFGSPEGNVYQAMTTGLDDGLPFTAIYVPVFDQMGVPGNKTPNMARLVMRANNEVLERLKAHADFQVDLPSPPDASLITEGNVWGLAEWGEAVWGGSSPKRIHQRWRSVAIEGEAISISAQITSGSLIPLDVEFIRTDVTLTVGDLQI